MWGVPNHHTYLSYRIAMQHRSPSLCTAPGHLVTYKYGVTRLCAILELAVAHNNTDSNGVQALHTDTVHRAAASHTLALLPDLNGEPYRVTTPLYTCAEPSLRPS